MSYSIAELIEWNKRIEELVSKAGLDCYEQEFEIVNYEDMISFMTYSGMPSHYTHWSLGKAYEITKTLHKYNLQGLPYEMVINSNPCLAYLMKDNTLLLQILTMAHVYGHNDFFKNNRLFKEGTRAELSIEMFKNHAGRVREYINDPSIGWKKVERILDAAHALRFQTNRHNGGKRLTYEQQRKQLIQDANKPVDEFRLLRSKEEKVKEKPVEIKSLPYPEEDLLYFLAEFAPLEDWEKDLIFIVAEETRYFLPMAATKIMNEGWATYWHYNILNKSNLEQSLHMEFLVNHNQVVRLLPGRINPYYVGFKVFEDIGKRYGEAGLFEARSLESDQSFLMKYLTYDLCREMNLFEFERKDAAYYVSEVSDEEGWKNIRNTLAASVGLNGIPVVKAVEVIKKDNTVILEHEYDGRELEFNYACETLKYFAEVWGGKVRLMTKLEGRDRVINCDDAKRITTT